MLKKTLFTLPAALALTAIGSAMAADAPEDVLDRPATMPI